MTPLPDADSERLSYLALRLTQATLADDDILRASLYETLRETVNEFAARHGQHPEPLETLADYTDDPADAVSIYLEARRLASRLRLSTHTIALSLAEVYLDDLADPNAARDVLKASTSDLEMFGDDFEREWFRSLMARCRRDS